MLIVAFDGFYYVDVGDYIIQGDNGGLFSCKPDIFEATYEDISQLVSRVE